MTNVDYFIDELGRLPHNGAHLIWFVEPDYDKEVVKITMKDRTRKPVRVKLQMCPFEDIMAMVEPRLAAKSIIEKMYYDFGEHIVDKKLLISPEEALKRLKELSEDLNLGWVDIYSPEGGADELVIEALDVAIACLEEKCHE